MLTERSFLTLGGQIVDTTVIKARRSDQTQNRLCL
jgi:hypothetical protein